MRFPLSRPVRSRRIITALAVLGAAGAASLAAAGSASANPMVHGPSADENQKFVMHEQVDHSTESYTFTSSGPLCPSGHFADHVTVESANAADTVVIWLVDTTYTSRLRKNSPTSLNLGGHPKPAIDGRLKTGH